MSEVLELFVLLVHKLGESAIIKNLNTEVAVLSNYRQAAEVLPLDGPGATIYSDSQYTRLVLIEGHFHSSAPV